MKVKELIKKLEKLDQDCKIYYCGFDEEGEELFFDIGIGEWQTNHGDGNIDKDYVIEKRE